MDPEFPGFVSKESETPHSGSPEPSTVNTDPSSNKSTRNTTRFQYPFGMGGPGSNPYYLNLMYCDDKELLAKMNYMQTQMQFNPSNPYTRPPFHVDLDKLKEEEDSEDEYLGPSLPPTPPGFKFAPVHEFLKTQPLTLVTREEWGALPPRAVRPMKYPIKNIITSYKSETLPCFSKDECMQRMRDLQQYHMEVENLSDIPYNFMVGHDGTLYEGRGWKAQSSASLKSFPQFFGSRLDFAYFGDYRKVVYPVATINAIVDFVKEQGTDEGLVFTCCDFMDYREDMEDK